MKTKTNELIGTALDWAVAKCEGIEYRNNWEIQYMPDGEVDVFVFHCTADDAAHAVVLCEEHNHNCTIYDYAEIDPFRPSTDWSQGGPIIEKYGIQIGLWDTWEARIFGDEYVAFVSEGDTPLIAAMRCVVLATLGNEIQIPEELLK